VDDLNKEIANQIGDELERFENEKSFGELVKQFRESNLAEEATGTIEKLRTVLEALPDEIEEIATTPLDKAEEILSTPGATNQDINDLREVLGEFRQQVEDNADIDEKSTKKLQELLDATDKRLELQLEGFGQKLARQVGDNIKAVTSAVVGKLQETGNFLVSSIGGDSPLVRNLTSFVTQGTKDFVLNTKNFLTQRKEAKQRSEENKERLRKELSVQELQEKQAQKAAERQAATEEYRESTTEINQNQSEILEAIKDDTSAIRSVVEGETESPKVEGETPSSQEQMIQEVVPAQIESTETVEELDARILEAIRSGDIELVNQLQAQKEQLANQNDLAKEQVEQQSVNREVQQQANLEVEAEKQRRDERMIQAIEGISMSEGVDVEEEKLDLSSALMALVGFTTAFISGFASSVQKQLQLVFGPIIKAFKNSKIGKLVSNVFSSIRGFFANIVTKFKGSKLGSFIDDIFKNISKSPIGKLFTKIGNTFKKLDKFVKPLFGSADEVAGIAGKFMRVGKALGSTLGKFFLPITVLLATIDTVKGFIQGFREGGLVEGVKGALEGLFSSLVGTPLNLLKDLVGWIAGKLGFENVQERLAEFDFNELYSKFVDAGFAFYGNLGESIMGAFNKLKTFFVDTFTDFDLSETLESISGVINRLFTALKDATVGKIKEIGANIPLVGRFFGGGENQDQDVQSTTEVITQSQFAVLDQPTVEPTTVELDDMEVKQRTLNSTVQMGEKFQQSQSMAEQAQDMAIKNGATATTIAPITNQNVTNSSNAVVIRRDVRNSKQATI